MEFLTAPMVFGLPAALGFGILLGTRTTHGVAGQYWLGMSGLILTGVLGGVFIGTLRVDKLPAAFSWPVLFGVPAAIGAVHTILAIVHGTGDVKRKGRMALSLIFALPLLLALVVFVLFGLWFGAAVQSDADSPFKSPPFWAMFVVWVIVLMVGWFVLPRVLRDIRIPEHPVGGKIGKRFVRLFDDTTLHQDAQLAGLDMPSLVYPSNRRKVMKLWWEGAGEKHLRSDRFQLVFADDDAGTNPQTVPAPIVPMTLDEYRLFLEAQVPGVKGELLFPESSDNPDYLLPAGATFSDHGDGEDHTALHDAAAARFQELGDSADDTDYVLYHAPKQRLAVLHGTHGTVPPARNVGAAPVAHDTEAEGYDYLHDATNFETSEALMSYAGDFGALLSLGATTHMSDLRDTANQDVDPVYQVFRNWNLDRRRVNEWRAIVAGGAENDKGSNRAGYDARMLKHRGPANPATFRSPLLGTAVNPSPAEQAAFDEGEATARQLGWVGLLRAWLDVVRLPAEDPLATHLTKTGNPPNQALSRAMAYLFDLADPEASP
jgi:hypothetical protein